MAITHDLSMIQGLDRVLWLEAGRIQEDGTPGELLADPDSQLARWAATQRGAADSGAGDPASADAGVAEHSVVESQTEPATEGVGR